MPRWVARDITLDGNTFRHSHGGAKRPWIGTMTYGLVVPKGPWRVALSRTHGTREFDGQDDAPVYGSAMVSYAP
nr:lipid A-modifier LpxR family protein [Xanthomonas sp.]